MEVATRYREPSPSRTRVFLSAEWRDLVMLNYEVDPRLLTRYVPRGTEVDSFQGKTFVSLVGFQFLHAKLFGALPVPLHGAFEEINLRFYVRRRVGNENRRGVAFIREIVPKRAVAQLATLVYGENYIRYAMRHDVSTNETGKTAEYQWKLKGKWCTLRAQSSGDPALPLEGSLEQFITEHYWGYSLRRNRCLEYHVSHVPWRIWPSAQGSFEGDSEILYGAELGGMLHRLPDSALIAEGSPVLVFAGRGVS
ncbi:MAG: YqjF family protein [Candidatus Acidiferrales bacterium]